MKYITMMCLIALCTGCDIGVTPSKSEMLVIGKIKTKSYEAKYKYIISTYTFYGDCEGSNLEIFSNDEYKVGDLLEFTIKNNPNK